MRHKISTDLRYPQLWKGCVTRFSPCLGSVGSTVIDQTQRRDHVTTSGASPPVWTVSSGVPCMSHDGSNAKIVVATQRYASTLTDTYSIEFWAKPATSTAGRFLYNYSGNLLMTYGVFYGLVAANKWGFAHNTNATLLSDTTATTTGAWQHVAFTKTGTTGSWDAYCYINGVLSSSTIGNTGNPGTTDASSKLTIGNLGTLNNSPWNGQWATIALYDRVLNASEVSILAMRPGIAHETIHRRSYKSTAATGFKAAWLNQRSQIIGGGAR